MHIHTASMIVVRHRVVRPVVYIAHNHDEWPMFRLWFAVTTVAASIILNLGIFALLVAAHALLDVIKYHTKHGLPWRWTVIETLRESLVDIFFITLGLLLGIAFHFSVAIGGLGRLAELEVILLNLLLRVGPRLKIAEHILEIVLYWKHHFEEPFRPHAPLSRGERWLCAATFLAAVAIVLTPLVTSVTWNDAVSVMQRELTPRLEVNITRTWDELTR